MSESNHQHIRKDVSHENASAAASTPQDQKSLRAALLKWASALPAVSYLLACANEGAFFGNNPVWELLRGTGEGGN
jgi:hypothetical protein